VFSIDESTEELVPHRVSGRHASAVSRLSIPIGERVSGWVAAAGQAMINADAMLDLFDAEPGALRSAAAFPCQIDEGRFVVTLYSDRATAFGAYHERLVAGAVSLLVPRWSRDAEDADLRWAAARLAPAKAHVLH
jgi:hypothetical protein